MHDGTNGSEFYPLRMLNCHLTGNCNLRCRHCMVGAKFWAETGQDPELVPDLYLHVVRQARSLGLFSVKLGGGEPFLHSRIGEILEISRREKVILNVETNAVLCTASLAKDLGRCRLLNFSVSLDGADAETHEWMRCVAGCFENAIRGIKNLVAEGIRLQIIMSVVRRNAGQMEALVRLAESLGACAVQFNFVRPQGRGEKMLAGGELLTVRELVRLGVWVENELSRRTKLPVYFTQPLAFRPLDKVFGVQGTGAGGCGILKLIGVLADGSYSLCGMGATLPDLVFGHAGQDTLEEVWHENPVLKEIREGLPQRFKGICGECLMKGICQGHCLAQNYSRSRDIWSPYWFCEEADKQGLFPAFRKQDGHVRTEQGDRLLYRESNAHVRRETESITCADKG